MTPLEQQALKEVLASRERPAGFKNLRDPKFKKQNAYLEDKSRLKALFCTRRAAKSYSGGLGLCEAALEWPGCSVLYIALTRDSAKKIMWKDVLKDINVRHDLRAVFNETSLTMTLPNGSVIYLTGVDANEEEKMKLLGQKYRRVVLDEASLYWINLRELVYGILKPAIADYRGDIWVHGTSGNITQGLFFDITTGKEPGWSVHEWSAHDNPYVAEQWQEELDEIARERPKFRETALYKQWYLNQWVVDTNKLVYWYQAGRNDYGTLPRYPGEWQYVLGVDLGYSPDPSAFVLLGFHDHDKVLYGISSEELLEQDVTNVADRIKWYQSRYNIFKVVIDGSNKQAVEEMQRRHGIALTAADKRGKADFIQILNAEFQQEFVRIDPKHNQTLITNWGKLVWRTEGDKIVVPREEHPGLPNHIPDAFLYGWRFCYSFLSDKPKKKTDLREPNAWRAHSEKLAEEQLEREIERQKATENESDFWAIADTDGSDENVLNHYLNKRKK